MRIPPEPRYLERMGLVTWEFAYYERAIVRILGVLQPGFLQTYFGDCPIYSGAIVEKLKAATENDVHTAFHDALERCLQTYDLLRQRRNMLIHAAPQLEIGSLSESVAGAGGSDLKSL